VDRRADDRRTRTSARVQSDSRGRPHRLDVYISKCRRCGVAKPSGHQPISTRAIELGVRGADRGRRSRSLRSLAEQRAALLTRYRRLTCSAGREITRATSRTSAAPISTPRTPAGRRRSRPWASGAPAVISQLLDVALPGSGAAAEASTLAADAGSCSAARLRANTLT
jgi:hypothetical protein